MRKINVMLILLIFQMSCLLVAETIIPSGLVSGTWTLTDSPYLITGDIEISERDRLDIEPGVVVEFQGDYSLNVFGDLSAEGTESQKIRFTINDTTGFSDLQTYLGWGGINFGEILETRQSAESKSRYGRSVMQYCIVEYSSKFHYSDEFEGFRDLTDEKIEERPPYAFGTAYAGGGISVGSYDNLIIDLCVISNNAAVAGGGIVIYDCSPMISNNDITYNNVSTEGAGIWVFDETGYRAEQNIPKNKRRDAASSPLIINNDISFNGLSEFTRSWGGGIKVGCGDASPIIEGNIISNNLSDSGSGILVGGWGFTEIRKNKIVNNISYYDAPGIRCAGDSNTKIFNNLICNN